MQAFLSDPNKLYLRHSAQNVVQTSSDEEKVLRKWNCEDNYLDLSPDEDKDKAQIKRMVLYKMVPPDFNAPLVAEQLVKSCFAVHPRHLPQPSKSPLKQAKDIESFSPRSPKKGSPKRRPAHAANSPSSPPKSSRT